MQDLTPLRGGIAPSVRNIRLEFTGSGSEYFRIWIVNLLLSLLTLGLYLPFAKVRRLRYFYANTLIDGEALAFHGDAWKMFRGFMLLALLMAAYGLAGDVSPWAGLPALLILWGIWPALWRASLQFRLANTSWRGLRFRFLGELRGAYLCHLPSYAPLLAIVLIGTLWPELGQAPPAPGGAATKVGFTLSGPVLAVLSLTLIALLLAPWSLALAKIYQHRHYAIAGQRSRFEGGVGDFYFLAFKQFLALLGGLVLAALLIGMLAFVGNQSKSVPVRTLVLTSAIAVLLLWMLLGWAYFGSRLQNLVWRRTRSAALRFDSDLGARALAWLTLKNWLLTLLSLGLYRPFAAVAMARLRLEAVRLRMQGGAETWTAAPGMPGHADASGDAAADFFGIDLGL